jgi:Fe-Mn family superoxide dismutase
MIELPRRTFIAGAASIAACTLSAGRVFAQTPPPDGPHKLPALPFAPEALEPHIDKRTMEIHHGKHHQAYVNNLNTALKDQPDIAKLPLEELLSKLDSVPEAIRTAVRNNGGGHANHTMFWQIMGPGGGAPEGELKAAIDGAFGELANLQEQFNTAGAKVFGSGWVFLTVDKAGKLALVSKPNQDTPLMEGGRVLMGNDVWEHAYYLNYQNRRADYLKAWWNAVNWKAVAARYAAAKAGTLTI